MGYEIVRYQPEFKEEVSKLLEVLWSRNPGVNAACLEWKYERNPYHSEPLLYLALDRGRVVGMRGMAGAKWEVDVGRQQFVIPCACDLAIAPDHRNRGLISKIMRFAIDDLRQRGTEYVFNLSAGQITFLNSLAMGWRSIGPLQRATRVNQREMPRDRMKRLLGRWPPALGFARAVKNQPLLKRYAAAVFATNVATRKALPPFSRLDRDFRAGRVGDGRRIVLEKSPRLDAMAELVGRTRGDGRIRHVRDRHYLSWRFAYPLGVYRFLYCVQSRLEGYLVLQASALAPEERSPQVTVADWEATSAQVLEALMMKAIRYGDFDELTAWKRAVPDPARAVLQKAGFQSEKQEEGKPRYRPTVLVKSTGNGKNPAEWRLADHPLLDPSHWDVRPMYSL